MTVTTTASTTYTHRGLDLPNVPHVEEVTAPDAHRLSVTMGEQPEPDPGARTRMAGLLYEVTGWDIFPELATDRDYASRLWAEDWDSPEDAIYDTE